MPDVITAINADTSLYEELVRDYLDRRILIFNSDVDDSNIENYLMYIIKWNQEDKNLPVEKRKPIRIYINSGGGDVMVSTVIIDVIANSKTPVYGICFGVAASAAYHVFLACHKRYGFKNSIFLQHDGGININQTSSKARDTMNFLSDLENRMKQNVLLRTTMSEEYYDKVYDQEFWMLADKAKSFGIVDYIIGEDCDIDEILD